MRSLSFMLILISYLITACGGSPGHVKKANKQDTNLARSAAVAESIKTEVVKHNLYHYPDLTLLLAVNDAQDAKRKILKAGGTIVYDPNLSVGHSIPFLVVTLTPDLVVNSDFVKSLNLKAAQIDHPKVSNYHPLSQGPLPKLGDEPIFVPVDDIGLGEFRNKIPGQGLGEGTVTAVIDTGIDASHPVFQDRVIYWKDLSQETRTTLKEVDVVEGKIDFNKSSVTLPENLKSNSKVYVALLSEESMRAQLGDSNKTIGEKGLDLNQNQKTDDKFLVVIGEVEGQWLAYSDFDQSSQFEMNEGPFNDFNKARNQSVEIFQNGLFVFPNRNKTVSYPLLININAEAKPESIELGIDFENHGTHVAGIAGGNGEQIRGAAPETKFMALKVCTGVTCTTAAILRALVEAFYNPQGLVPDVVNISLGSHEGYEQDVFNYLMRDLASKFGTIFFISASNDGIGYRSINSIGSFGPVVSVGAHVSKDSLEKLYNLAPGVEAPLNSLLFFSSVGPSYTGQLRPNIVAPGAALSSLPLIGGGSALYNGTSMSSPISAGAASALLSLYKKTDGYAEWAKAREEKIKDIQNGGDGTVGGSLMKYPLALRTSLEETAEKMPYYTTAQQGHGLINIPRAFEHLTALQKSVDSDSTLFFDVEINSSAKNNRLYDRSVNIADVKTVGLSQEFDGELNEEKRLLIQNHTFEVRLERVEVQDTNGAVTTLTNDLPFAMSQGRGDGTARRSIPIVLSNNYKKLFYSVRNLSAMEEGKTYVAVYGLYDGATRVFTLLDVVHKPILLTTELKTHYLPGIESNAFKRSASFSKAGVDIKANEFHRYPIAVTAQDSQVNLDVALHPNAYGNLYVQVYDQDGSEIYFGQLNSDPQHPTESRKISVQLDVEEAGIYEVAFSAGNRAWMGPTKYDFIAGVSRFKASVERLDFDLTGKSEDKKTIALTDSSNQITDITLSSLDLVPMVEIKNVPVKPAHWTYVKVDPPKFVKNNSVWIVSVADDKKVDQSYFGRVDERLYVRKPNGDYEPVESALPQASSGTRKVFTDVDFEGKEIYAALETIDVVPESDGLKGALKKLTLDVIFPGNESTVAMQTSLRTEGGFYFIDVNVSRGSTKPNGVTYMGVIEVETNDERTGLEVPVKVRL